MQPKEKRPKFAPAASPMEVIIGLSRYYGGDPECVIAGGGNTSLKIGDRLYVKASGSPLATIGAEGFVEMDRKALAALLERDLGSDATAREAAFKEAIHAARIEPEKGQRPSVECVLHHLIPGAYVVHSHSTWVNMLTCSTGGEDVTRELFGDDVLWIPYVDPGFVLARTLAAALKDYARRTKRTVPDAVFMQNHGLIIAGDTADEVFSRTDAVVEKIRRKVEALAAKEPFGAVSKMDASRARVLINVIGPSLRALLATRDALKVVTFDDSQTILDLVGGASGEASAKGGPLNPDQIVYCKAFPMWFEPIGDDSPGQVVAALRSAVEGHKAVTRFAPQVVLVKGLGLFAVGDDIAAADTIRLVYTDAVKVMAGAKALGGIRFMPEREREFIENWEVENYRRAVAAAGARRGRAAGKVAFVTGAAQGFGFEIARDLLTEGAHVALADINLEGVCNAAISCGAPNRATGVAVDVTSGASVADAVHAVVRHFGGFDLVVSNAGVLRAGSVKTQSEKEFEFVTDVNYKGYFNCVRNAAPIMAVQRLARPGYTSDIIQINSKSGLIGSNRNGAYAGSKFGGIGLTQSFALELIEDGIKVNAICPGNFFEGPLWSDPKNGLFAQYLRSGKVPGAKTLDDVRRAYEAKVPMGRGCTAADVMKAIYYLVDQQYETGQALPVTGGQVMLG